jgi:ABC-type transporter MlaC component
MTTPQITIHDAITGETVTRDFNADELDQLEKNKTQAKLDEQAARQAVLDKLGLTADEANALLG